MKKTCFISLMLIAIMVVPCSFAQKPSFTVGLVSDGALKANAEVAYKWAQSKFNAQVIPIPKSKADLTKFGVVWWDESNGPSIPNAFTDQAVINSFLNYVKDGGGLLLSNLALHYVNEMGLEANQLRYFGANANIPLDWTDLQIAKGQEKHPIFNGMKVEGGVIQYDILGYCEGSDFYGANGPTGPQNKNSKLLAQTIDKQPQCNGLVEYTVDAGTIIVIGWVWSSFAINAKLEDIHGPLHNNIIKYLATKSKFAAVDLSGKLTSTWGSIKAD